MSETISAKYENGNPRYYGPYNPVHCYPQVNPTCWNPSNEKGYISNAAFAKADQAFQSACQKAGIEPTPRQASKWRRKTGLAYLFSKVKFHATNPVSVDEFKLELTRKGQS